MLLSSLREWDTITPCTAPPTGKKGSYPIFVELLPLTSTQTSISLIRIPTGTPHDEVGVSGDFRTGKVLKLASGKRLLYWNLRSKQLRYIANGKSFETVFGASSRSPGQRNQMKCRSCQEVKPLQQIKHRNDKKQKDTT